jgi:hypothetical protein
MGRWIVTEPARGMTIEVEAEDEYDEEGLSDKFASASVGSTGGSGVLHLRFAPGPWWGSW